MCRRNSILPGPRGPPGVRSACASRVESRVRRVRAGRGRVSQYTVLRRRGFNSLSCIYNFLRFTKVKAKHSPTEP